MSKSQQAPPDSWDMDPNDSNAPNAADSSVTPGLGAMSLNVNAPTFVPNINAPAFVPSGLMSAPPSTAQAPAPSSATSTPNGKIIILVSNLELCGFLKITGNTRK